VVEKEVGLHPGHRSYMGPIGLLLYVLADKEPRPGEHGLSSSRRGTATSRTTRRTTTSRREGRRLMMTIEVPG